MMNTLNLPRCSTGLASLVLALTLAGCAQVKEKPVLPTIQDELRKAAETPKAKALPAAVEARDERLIEPILVGPEHKIRMVAEKSRNL